MLLATLLAASSSAWGQVPAQRARDITATLVEGDLLGGIRPQCIEFSFESEMPAFVDIGVFEKYEPPCSGDPSIHRRLLRLRYERAHGHIFLVDDIDSKKIVPIGSSRPWPHEQPRRMPQRTAVGRD